MTLGEVKLGTLALKPAADDGIIFVAAEGRDVNDGLSWGTAKKTIGAAIAALPPIGMGTIEIGAGAFILGAGGGVVYRTKARDAPSIVLRGRGRYATIIHAPAGGGTALTFQSSSEASKPNFQKGLWIEHLAIERGEEGGEQHGIYIKGVWQAHFVDVRIEGLTSGTAIRVDSPLGDEDAPVSVTLDTCYLWGNGWGLRATCGPGTGSISNLALRSCMIQDNSLGGIYFTGAVASIRDTGIATNQGVGGLKCGFSNANCQGLEVTSSSFENNSPRHIDIASIQGAVFTNVDFRHTSHIDRPATDGVRIKPAAGGGLGFAIEFRAPFIRVLSDYTPYTFLVLDGTADDTSEIRGVTFSSPRWQDFDHDGQSRAKFSGQVHDVHLIPPGTIAVSPIPRLKAGDNHNVLVSDDAEVFVLNGIPDPATITGLSCLQYEGRRLVLIFNYGGGDLTLAADRDTSSAKSNCLRLPGGKDVKIEANCSVIVFCWSARTGNPGWLLESLSKG